MVRYVDKLDKLDPIVMAATGADQLPIPLLHLVQSDAP
jgi:hypothetical protein